MTDKIDLLLFIFGRGEVRFKDLEEKFVKNPEKTEDHISKQTLVKYLNELMRDELVRKIRQQDQYFRYSVTSKGMDFIKEYIRKIEKKAVVWRYILDLCYSRDFFDYLGGQIQAYLEGEIIMNENDLSKAVKIITENLAYVEDYVRNIEEEKEVIGKKEFQAIIASVIKSLQDLRFQIDALLCKATVQTGSISLDAFFKKDIMKVDHEIRKTIWYLGTRIK